MREGGAENKRNPMKGKREDGPQDPEKRNFLRLIGGALAAAVVGSKEAQANGLPESSPFESQTEVQKMVRAYVDAVMKALRIAEGSTSEKDKVFEEFEKLDADNKLTDTYLKGFAELLGTPKIPKVPRSVETDVLAYFRAYFGAILKNAPEDLREYMAGRVDAALERAEAKEYLDPEGVREHFKNLREFLRTYPQDKPGEYREYLRLQNEVELSIDRAIKKRQMQAPLPREKPSLEI